MKPKLYSSEAVILARKNYGEADRIIVVYSKDYGKLSLIAKGVRKLVSKKRGSLEVFNRIRFAAVRGKSLDVITETEIVDNFEFIRKDLKKVAVGYFGVEVIGRITRDDEKSESLYGIIVDFLEKLVSENNLATLRRRFIFDVLVNLGFWPKSKIMLEPDIVLENILEHNVNSVRVGKRMLS